MADDAASTAAPGDAKAPDSSGDLLQMLEDRLHEVAMEAAGREPEPSPWHLVSPWEALLAQRNSLAQNQERKQEWIDLPQRQQPPAPPASPAADEGDAVPAQAPEADSLQVPPLNPWQDASSGQQPPILPEVPSWDSLMEKVTPGAGAQSTLRNRGWEPDDLLEQYASPPKKEEYVDVNDPKQVADLHSGLEKVLEAMALNMRTEIGHGVEYGAGGAQGYGEANLFADPRNRPAGGGSFYYRSGLIGGHAAAAIQGVLEMMGGGGAALGGGAIDLAGLVPAATGVGIPLSVLAETGGTALALGGLAVAGHGAAVAGNSGRLLWDDLMHAMSDSSPSKDGGQTSGGGENSQGGGAGKPVVGKAGGEPKKTTEITGEKVDQKVTKEGGSHGEMIADKGDELDSHHMPSRDSSPLKPNEGPAIKMVPADHQKTASFGRLQAAIAHREKQRRLIAEGRFDEAFEMDVADLQSKFGDKYEKGIDQARSYKDTIPKEKLKVPNRKVDYEE